MPPNQFQDFLGDVMEEIPRLPFYSFVGEQARSPQQRRFFSNQFSDVYNQFLGALGTQARAGQMPSMRFTDFLQQKPFSERFTSQPPAFRGVFQSSLAPRARKLFF